MPRQRKMNVAKILQLPLTKLATNLPLESASPRRLASYLCCVTFLGKREMAKISKPEYEEKVKKLSEEEVERLLSRMSGKLPRRLQKEKLGLEDALAIQMELEDEHLQEWRKMMAILNKKNAAKAKNKSAKAATEKPKGKTAATAKTAPKTAATAKAKSAAKPTAPKARTPAKRKSPAAGTAAKP